MFDLTEEDIEYQSRHMLPILENIQYSQIADEDALSAPMSPAKDFQSYNHDGLNLRHPAHWSFAYDDSFSQYANRDISFSPTEFSRASVLVYEDNTIDEVDVADRFARSLLLETSKNVKHFVRSPIELSGFKGVRLSWTNTLLTRMALT